MSDTYDKAMRAFERALDEYDRCTLCGEPCDGRAGGTAEMNGGPVTTDPGRTVTGGVVHAECGLDAGWSVS